MHAQYSEALAERGFSVSRQGLQRLLGAPIGTTEFMCRPAADGGHLARLTEAAVRFVGRILQSIQEAALSLLATKSLTYFQSQMIQMPTRHAGLGLSGPLNTMHQAYVGSLGAVARFYSQCTWYDRGKLQRLISHSPAAVSAIGFVNDELRRSRKGSKDLLNLLAPATWPTQESLSSPCTAGYQRLGEPYHNQRVYERCGFATHPPLKICFHT